jgi:hypothetical protein
MTAQVHPEDPVSWTQLHDERIETGKVQTDRMQQHDAGAITVDSIMQECRIHRNGYLLMADGSGLMAHGSRIEFVSERSQAILVNPAVTRT